jgi:hypothetical protein
MIRRCEVKRKKEKWEMKALKEVKKSDKIATCPWASDDMLLKVSTIHKEGKGKVNS